MKVDLFMVFGIRIVVAKEKTAKTKKELKKISKKQAQHSKNNIVLSIDNDKRITKYNKECEKILGFNKKEALNQPIFNFLIPDSYVGQWNYMVDNSQKNKRIDDFKLPLLNKQGEEVWVSWSCFPVKNAQGVLVDINLVGNLISTVKEEKEPLIEFSEFETKEIEIKKPKKELIEEKKSEDYENLQKMIKNLKRKNSDLEKENKNLEKNLNSLKYRIDQIKVKGRKQKKSEKHVGMGFQSLSEKVGSKKRKQELENMMQELYEREKLLNDLESKLTKDKIKIEEQTNDFRNWRIKLESLETEIENRKKELLTQEKFLTEKIEPKDFRPIEIPKEEKVVKYHDLLDKIPDSAVVIHRGILKQVNSSFANLIRYEMDEILNKSLFDFIIPEDLSEVKEFYINRLQGVDVSVFETTLLTKDNDEILVEISTKPTDFKGKKAEIAVIKTIKSKKEEK